MKQVISATLTLLIVLQLSACVGVRVKDNKKSVTAEKSTSFCDIKTIDHRCKIEIKTK